MTQALTIKIAGLYLNYNEFSEVPPGALSEATNIDILQNSVAQPRKGLEQVALYPNVNHRANLITSYKGTLLSVANISGASYGLYNKSGSTWLPNSVDMAPPASAQIRTLIAGNNLYYTTSKGVFKSDTVIDARPAGAPKALDMVVNTSASTPAWMATAKTVAYRGLWTRTDANGLLVRGAPSTRFLCNNTSGSSQSTVLTVTSPLVLGSGETWVFQLYRSEQVATGIEPNDELGLVAELSVALTGSRSSFTITDTCEDALRGATLYTAQSQEGLANQNDLLPLAKDIATYQGSTFYFDVASTQRTFLTLNGIGGTSGIAADDTLTITTTAGISTYTAKATESIPFQQFKVFTGGTALKNMTDTVESLVRVINRGSTSNVFAYAVSAANEVPGQILIEQVDIKAAAFSLTSSKSTCWVPALPSSGVTVVSKEDRYPNGVYWSKSDQPESVPLVNFQTIGQKSNRILRGIALHQALYIFKENEGLYKITGYYPNFQIDLVDTSVRLICPESAQVLGNRIYCLTEQGVCAVDDSTSVLSRPIERGLLPITTQNTATVFAKAFGVANERERSYSLYMPSSSGTSIEFSYVYNSFSNAWTRHNAPATCGYIGLDGEVYLGSVSTPYVNKKRRTDTNLDYVDYGTTTTIDTINLNAVTLGIGVTGVGIGDIVYQSSTQFGTVVKINPDLTIILDNNPGLTTGAADLLKAIPTRMTWCAVSFSNPAIQHQFNTATLVFREGFLGTGTMEFVTDTSQLGEVLDIIGHYHTRWGMFGWGTSPWGSPSGNDSVRQWVPRNKQRASTITPTYTSQCGYSGWKLTGLSIFGIDGSEEIGRNNG